MTDNRNQPKKYRIPTGTTITVVVDEICAFFHVPAADENVKTVIRGVFEAADFLGIPEVVMAP